MSDLVERAREIVARDCGGLGEAACRVGCECRDRAIAVIELAHKEAASRIEQLEADAAKLKAVKNVYKAKNASKTRLLERVREVITDVAAGMSDEGDRVYLGSTNDADTLRALSEEVESWKWDSILRQSEGDPYATIRQQRARIEQLEAENARLREALDRAGKSLTKASLCNSEKIDDAKTIIAAALAGKAGT